MPHYAIHIISKYKLLKKLSGVLIIMLLVGLLLWSIIDFPVKNLPAFYSAVYYTDIVPPWILKIIFGLLFAGVVGFIVTGVQKHNRGTLIIENEGVLFKNERIEIKIAIADLKRIPVIKKHLRFKPYRIIFLERSKRRHHVRLSSFDQMVSIISDLKTVCADHTEFHITNFE